MKKFRKIYFVVLTTLAAVCMLTLSGCRVLADERADVVFVSAADTPVGSVGLTCETSAGITQNADNSFLTRGESCAFQVDSYPVTVTVYGDTEGRQELAFCTIEGEPEGDRWYVVARDGESGLVLEAGNCWPEEGTRP